MIALLADISPLGDPLFLGAGLLVLVLGLGTLWLLAVRVLPAVLRNLLPQEPTSTQPRPVVYFDGVCGLCNHAVDLILRHDAAERFLFATLQGEVAERELGRKPDDPMDSLVLVDALGRHERSTAALRIAWHLGGVWRVLSWLRVVPRGIRDPAYDAVARVRYRLFGQKETCRMPTPAERARFLG